MYHVYLYTYKGKSPPGNSADKAEVPLVWYSLWTLKFDSLQIANVKFSVPPVICVSKMHGSLFLPSDY